MHAGELTLTQSFAARFRPGAVLEKQVKVTDVSFWQDDNTTERKIDFVKMMSAGTSGVFMRAGQNTWKDPDFDDYARDSLAAGIKRGAYWYYDSRTSPITQANLFHSIISDKGLEMEIVADYEESYGGSYGGASNLRKFIERLIELGIPKNKIMIYTGYYYWGSNSGGTDTAWFGQFPLWIAWYTTDPSRVLIPSPWNKATYWQWTSNGDGPAHGVESLSIDLNWFNGTQEDFNVRYGITTPDDPVSKVLTIEVYSDGTYIVKPANTAPPVIGGTRPLRGTFTFDGDGRRFFRAHHDNPSRTHWNPSGLRQTNETIVGSAFDPATFKLSGKEITRLDFRWSWVNRFIAMMNKYIWGLYVQPGFGFQDTNAKDTDPNVGPFKQQSLSCGGNLHEGLRRFLTSDGAYWEVAIQDYYAGPGDAITYESAPELVTKQVLTGHSITSGKDYQIVDQNRGDLVWPWVCDKPVAIAERDLEEIPLPFDTTYEGRPITIDGYCFSGSTTYGHVKGYDKSEGWIIVEEMEVTGRGNVENDRRVYVTGWIDTAAPPVKGWTKTNATILEVLAWVITGRLRLARYTLNGKE